jgi:hypothetical protein
MAATTRSRRTVAKEIAHAIANPRFRHFRPVGASGEEYPAWLRALRGARGAYVIRNASTKKILYVGSSKGSLYATITRHFQEWRRKKKWWSEQYGRGHDPGMTYKRGDSEVAVQELPAGGDHLVLEATLIHRLRPRDNLVERPDGNEEVVPF